MNKTKDMTVGSPTKTIFFFSVPVLLGTLFQQIYNMADTIIVGQFLGEDALAAVGATGSTVYLVIGFASGLTQGCGILVSQAFGGHRLNELKKVVGTALLLTDKSNPIEDVFILIQVKDGSQKNYVSSVFLEHYFCYFEKTDNTLAKKLLKEYKEKKPDYEYAVAGYLTVILTQIVRKMLPKDFKNIIGKDNLNDKRFAIIEQAFLYEKDLTLTKLSTMIGLCERQTQRLLKKYYKKSFRELKKLDKEKT